MKLFTKTICPKCMLVKTILESEDIDYEAVNIDKDDASREVLLEQGISSVPVILYKDKFYTGSEINSLVSELTQ